MKKIYSCFRLLLVFLTLASLGCVGSKETTYDNCSEVSDLALCPDAMGKSGKLGCKVHQWLKKCSDENWWDKVEKGQCELIPHGDCRLNSKIVIAENTPNGPKAIGLCAFNQKTTKCEEAPKSTGEKRKCVRNPDLEIVKKAADELCNQFQMDGGEDPKRKTLKPGQKCEGLLVDSGGTGGSLSGVCQRLLGTKFCTGYRSAGRSQINIDVDDNSIKNFCRGLSQPRFMANADLSGLVEEDDLSLCGKTALWSQPLKGEIGYPQPEAHGEELAICVAQ